MSDVIERIEKGELAVYEMNKGGFPKEYDGKAEKELLELAKLGQGIVDKFKSGESCPLEKMGFEVDGAFCDDECLFKDECAFILNMPLPPAPKEEEL